jgi:cytochrome b subunit of formate dehydrogenase
VGVANTAGTAEYTTNHKSCQIVNAYTGMKITFPANAWSSHPAGVTSYAIFRFLTPFMKLKRSSPVYL